MLRAAVARCSLRRFQCAVGKRWRANDDMVGDPMVPFPLTPPDAGWTPFRQTLPFLGHDLPARVRVNEMGPRDGLQNEPQTLATAIKAEFVQKLAETGLQEIETTSFVSPKWVPQMADAAQLMGMLRRKPEVAYPVLTPNLQGLERAIAAGALEVAVFASASESFSQRNINCSIDESMHRYHDVCKRALESGLRVRGYLSCVLGCPYEGFISPAAVARVSERLFSMGCFEVSLGDTIGVGTPATTERMLRETLRAVPVEHVGVHFHDTYGQALANILASLQMGVSVVDASVAGLGGCPYAKGASGNVATEDVIYMLHGFGIKTGVDLMKLVDVGHWISSHLGRPSRSRAALALSARRSASMRETADADSVFRISERKNSEL